jgi:two-component system, OmpR family, response regulator
MDSKDRILIVDDDPEIRQLLVAYLLRHGCDAVPAANGREMEQMLARHAIDWWCST